MKIAALLSLLATIASSSFADCICAKQEDGLSHGTILLIIDERVHGNPILAEFPYNGLNDEKRARLECQREMLSSDACHHGILIE